MYHATDQHRLSPAEFVRNPNRGHASVYFFDSPKNDRRFGIFGVVAFSHLLLAEGNPEILSYLPSRPPKEKSEKKYKQTVDVLYQSGKTECWHFNHSRNGEPTRHKNRITKTEGEIRMAQWLPHNWMLLCSYRTRVRGAIDPNPRALPGLISARSSFTLQEVLALEDCDPAHLLASVERYLANGKLKTELRTSAFHRRSLLERVE